MDVDVIEKILLHLYDCAEVNPFTYQLRKRSFIIDYAFGELRNLSRKQIQDGIRDLYKQKLINRKQNYDRSVLVSLTEKGRLRALNFCFKNFSNRKEKWDGKWRIVAFDIPEECSNGRKALVYRFKYGEFYELQKSLFVYPYDCKKEVMALAKMFKLEKYVRFILADSIDNEERIKHHFKLW
jgi:DNA-binding transcriptional regulator PaaX